MESSNLTQQEETLYQILSSDRFQTRKGPGNDLPFYIYPYDPADEIEMERMCQRLTQRLRSDGHPTCHINLYDLALEILQERDVWTRLVRSEQSVTQEQLLKMMKSTLNAERYLAPAIEAKATADRYKLILLTGVGTAYPFIRVHTLLNNLHSVITDQPLITFFPGKYEQSIEEGARLSLFNRLHDDRYYRAYNLKEYV